MHKPHEEGRFRGQGGRPAQRHESGQAMVEFALTIIVTLLLIFGMIDFSRAIYTASVIQWAAQQGARAGIVNASEANVRAAVQGRMAGLDPTLATISVTRPGNNVVQVDVSYPFEFIIPMISRITGDRIILRASASMVAF